MGNRSTHPYRVTCEHEPHWSFRNDWLLQLDMALSSLPGTEGQSSPAPTGDSFHRMSNPGREAQGHHGFKTKTMEYRMLLMNQTNESSPRPLKPSILLRRRKSKEFLDTKYQLTITAGTNDSTMTSIQVWTRDNPYKADLVISAKQSDRIAPLGIGI